MVFRGFRLAFCLSFYICRRMLFTCDFLELKKGQKSKEYDGDAKRQEFIIILCCRDVRPYHFYYLVHTTRSFIRSQKFDSELNVSYNYSILFLTISLTSSNSIAEFDRRMAYCKCLKLKGNCNKKAGFSTKCPKKYSLRAASTICGGRRRGGGKSGNLPKKIVPRLCGCCGGVVGSIISVSTQLHRSSLKSFLRSCLSYLTC